jgi:hypothetical protein
MTARKVQMIHIKVIALSMVDPAFRIFSKYSTSGFKNSVLDRSQAPHFDTLYENKSVQDQLEA